MNWSKILTSSCIETYDVSAKKSLWEWGCLPRQQNRDSKRVSVAVRTGLGPVTPCVTGMYSNQLN